MLSGQPGEDHILDSAGAIHQFLAKPCDAETLKNTLIRCCELTNILGVDDLREMLAEIESLPSPPSVYDKLLATLEIPDVAVGTIGEVISQDVGMTSKILQFVNSAFFGLRRHIATPAQAVAYLGLSTVKALTISVRVFSQLNATSAKGFSHEAFLEHGMAVGALARKIASAEGADREACDRALTAGVLHDIGQLACATRRPKEYEAALALAKRSQIPLFEAERQVHGVSHAEIGGYLLGLWAFDISVVEAVGLHHAPASTGSSAFSILTAVHVGNVFARLSGGEEKAGPEAQVDLEYLRAIGCEERLSAWETLCCEEG